MESTAPPIVPAPFPLENSPNANTPYLQIAHVLFMDIVGFGRLKMAAQGGVQLELQKIVQETEAVRQAQAQNVGLVAHSSGDGVLVHLSRHSVSAGLIIRPLGDGMALVFFHDLLSPVRCAVEISNLLSVRAEEIKARTGGQIKLRMGIHTGPVLMVEDLNGQADVAGDGIIYAQRVMDCGDAGHILLSDSAAKAIERLDPWSRWLTDLGTCRVKHNIPVHLYNLCGRTVGGPANFGNVSVPGKVFADTVARRDAALSREVREKRWEAEEGIRPYVRSLVMMLCMAGLIGCIGTILWLRSPQTLRELARYAVSSLSGGPQPPTKLPPNPEGQVKPPVGKEDGFSTNGGGIGGGETQPNPSKPANPQLVPDLSGSTLQQAKLTGASQHFRVRENKNRTYDDEAAGLVCRQSPPVGAALVPNSVVWVAISKGPKPEPGDTTLSAPTESAPTSEPAPFQPAAPPPPAPEPWTSIIIDASHLPAMKGNQHAAILGADTRLYPDIDADDNEVLIHYYASLAEAKKRMGGTHPLLLKAEGVAAPHGIDTSVKLSDVQMNQWNEAAAYLNLSESHKVAVVLAP